MCHYEFSTTVTHFKCAYKCIKNYKLIINKSVQTISRDSNMLFFFFAYLFA